MKLPLVSAIVVVRNGELYIKKAIESIIAQEYEPLEILLVDGNSTDKTLQIAGSYPNVQIASNHDKGIANAYNLGITKAKGEFIAFLSHDDFWVKDKLKIQIEFLRQNPEILFSVSQVKFFLENKNEVPEGFRTELLEGNQTGYIMETLVARREVFDLIGGFDEKFTTCEDTDWFAKARDCGIASAVIPKVLTYKRIHGENTHLRSASYNPDLLRAVRKSIDRKRLK